MPGVAGEVKVIFVAQTASYSASVDKMRKETKGFGDDTVQAGRKTRQSMSEATGSVRLLGEELGIHLPRHVSTFVAKLPGITNVMAAAFSSIAVITLGRALVEAGTKVYEFIQKNEEAAKKNREAWGEISKSVRSADLELEASNAKIEESIAKLEHKPGDALKAALLEAAGAAEKLAEKLTVDIDKMAELNTKSTVGLVAQLLGGKASTGDLDRTIDDSVKTFQRILGEYEPVKTAAARAGDKENLARTNREEQAALERELGPNIQYLDKYLRNEMNMAAIDPTGPDRSANIAKAKNALETLVTAVKALGDQADESANSVKLEMLRVKDGKQATAASASPLAPGYDTRVSNVSHFSPTDVAAARAQALINAADAAEDLKAAQEQAAAAMKKWMEGDPLGTMQLFNQQVKQLTVTLGPQISPMTRALDEMTTAFNDTAQRLSEVIVRGIQETNVEIAHAMTGQRTDWGRIGIGFAQDMSMMVLQKAEGSLLKKLGFGTKADGTMNNPFWVRDASTATTAGASTLFSGMGEGVSNVISKISPFLGGLIPGFADGGDIRPNVPSIVGERGPEIFMPKTAGTIIPNKSLSGFGGGVSVSIDARGSNDPAAVEAAAHRAMAAWAPQLISAAKYAVHDHNRRGVSSARL